VDVRRCCSGYGWSAAGHWCAVHRTVRYVRGENETAVCPAGESKMKVPSQLNESKSADAMLTGLGVAVVICTYDPERWPLLLAAVSSAFNQELPPLEVIIVVDHHRSLLERVRRELPCVTVAENAFQRGLPGGKNTGIAVATAPIIAFLDDDAEASPDWLSRLVPNFLNPHVMGAGAAVHATWVPQRPLWFPEEFDWVVGCSHLGLPTAKTPVRNVLGGACVMRRELFTAVGGYRLGLGRVGKHPAGCEETELCIRARQQLPNAFFVFEPEAIVRQQPPADRCTFRYFRRRCFAEGSSKALVREFVGARAALSTEMTYVTRTLPKAICTGLWAGGTGDAWGFVRAGVVACGLIWTAAGYALGRFLLWRERSPQTPAAAPAITAA